MAHKKSAGATKNLGDSQPKYLGVKLNDGQQAKTGAIIIRQRGTRYRAGRNVGIGKDHTLFAKKDGTVQFRTKKRTRFDGSTVKRKFVDVV